MTTEKRLLQTPLTKQYVTDDHINIQTTFNRIESVTLKVWRCK